MSTAAVIGLMLIAGLMHAGWNLAAKRLRADRTLFLIALSPIGVVLTLPWALTHLPAPEHWAPVAGFVAVRVVLNAIYLVTLSRSYRVLDLSVAYPIARGSGPLVATILAVSLLGERPDLIGVVGVLIVSAAIVSMAGANPKAAVPQPAMAPGPAVRWPILTGVTIGCYTALDKAAVAVIDPVTYLAFVEFGTFLVLGAAVTYRGRAGELGRVLVSYPWQLLAAAAMVIGSYALALIALSHSYASYVAPLREVAVVYAVVFGIVVLGERHAARRIPAALGIVSGLAMVGVAM
ncbi:SMR family transporter [Phytoactinopolyspora mesophila]|uniref:EamA family transporter n=1 Tax=Phytoactinopolyspora mesophila TaxID=2650750 RepID=A0A7K3LY22_9ACTN|nr:SMR family transporter [Phytoactinopolyspora mesophila]NDL55923.1 EamA family transporter [Phytoactinopolyspora mesophila]